MQDDFANAIRGYVSVDSSLCLRIHFQAHDLFQPQPVKGADVYLLRMVLHNWPDKEAISIVKNLVAVMDRGSRIIIMDMVLPEAGVLPSAVERLLRTEDVTMLSMFNSSERDFQDWFEILKAADERLNVVHSTTPKGSAMSLMEVRLDL